MPSSASGDRWYLASDSSRGLRQIVCELGGIKPTKSRFDNLVLKLNKYAGLLGSVATGFFKTDADPGPYLLIKIPGCAHAMAHEVVVLGFTFCHMPSGPVFAIFAQSPIVQSTLTSGSFIDIVYSMDRLSGLDDLIQEAFRKETLTLVFAQPGGMTGTECQLDAEYPLSPSLRKVFEQEWARLVDYGQRTAGWGAPGQFAKSRDELYARTPTSRSPFLPRSRSHGKTGVSPRNEAVSPSVEAKISQESLITKVKICPGSDNSIIAAHKLAEDYGFETALVLLLESIKSEYDIDKRHAVTHAIERIAMRFLIEEKVVLKNPSKCAMMLIPHLSERKYMARCNVAETLGMIGDKIAVEPLQKVVKSKDGDDVKHAAACALQMIQGASSVCITHEQIAQRAKAIWQAKGCPVGQDKQIWHEAEAQLRAEAGLVSRGSL